jgi:hypothetical protein
LNGFDHLESKAFVEWYVRWFGCLEVSRDVAAIAYCKAMREESRAITLALSQGVNTDNGKVPMSRPWMRSLNLFKHCENFLLSASIYAFRDDSTKRLLVWAYTGREPKRCGAKVIGAICSIVVKSAPGKAGIELGKVAEKTMCIGEQPAN